MVLNGAEAHVRVPAKIAIACVMGHAQMSAPDGLVSPALQQRIASTKFLGHDVTERRLDGTSSMASCL